MSFPKARNRNVYLCPCVRVWHVAIMSVGLTVHLALMSWQHLMMLLKLFLVAVCWIDPYLSDPNYLKPASRHIIRLRSPMVSCCQHDVGLAFDLKRWYCQAMAVWCWPGIRLVEMLLPGNGWSIELHVINLFFHGYVYLSVTLLGTLGFCSGQGEKERNNTSPWQVQGHTQ